jgi:hypothetical protein
MVPGTATAQEDPKAAAQRQVAEAEAKAIETEQLRKTIDELQAKLQQARDELQQALEGRAAVKQSDERWERVRAARDEGQAERIGAEEERRQLKQALEAKGYISRQLEGAAAAAKQAEANRARAEHLLRSKQEAPATRNEAWLKLSELADQLKRDPKAAEAQARLAQLRELQAKLAANAEVQSGAPDDYAVRRQLMDAASRALNRAEDERVLEGMLQRLHLYGRHEEAASLEAKGRELGIPLAGQRQQALEGTKQPAESTLDAAPAEADPFGGILRAIEELRLEVRQLRTDVQSLRKQIEARPAANQGARAALRRENLVRTDARLAGERVRVGRMKAASRALRPIRAGDAARQGKVLAVVACDEILEKEYD